MNAKKYEKRLEFLQKMISRQSKQIELLKSQNENLKLQIQEKDEIINSIAPLKEELIQNVSDVKKYKKEYRGLIDELRKMKKIVNQEIYKGRWKLVRFLIK